MFQKQEQTRAFQNSFSKDHLLRTADVIQTFCFSIAKSNNTSASTLSFHQPRGFPLFSILLLQFPQRSQGQGKHIFPKKIPNCRLELSWSQELTFLTGSLNLCSFNRKSPDRATSNATALVLFIFVLLNLYTRQMGLGQGVWKALFHPLSPLWLFGCGGWSVHIDSVTVRPVCRNKIWAETCTYTPARGWH